MERFFIDKLSGTFADELTAAGLLRLLAQLLAYQGDPYDTLTLSDQGAYYQIESPYPLNPAALATFQEPCAPLIRTLKNGNTLPADLPLSPHMVVDYEQEKERRKAYWEAVKALPTAEARKAHFAGGEQDNLIKPHPDMELFQAINPAALIGYNGLMLQWFEACRTPDSELLDILLSMFRQTPNETAVSYGRWQKIAKQHDWKLTLATTAQLFNPAQGKGINRPKPNSSATTNLDNFWLLEWLKAVGFYEMGFTRTLQGVNDRKSYVMAPGYLLLQSHRQIKEAFTHKMRFAETAVRSDILTVLRYLEAFIQNVKIDTLNEELPSWMRGQSLRPCNFMRGFHMAYYKDMGNAVVTMNLAFLNLPGWVVIETEADQTDYQEILAEHEKMVQQFHEDRGEEITLLQRYRDFVVADNLAPFFQFTTAYSSYIISHREKRGGYAQQFSTQSLWRLITMSEPSYSEILQNEGFRNIAYAIRQSTVIAQYRKGQGDRRYDIRYGLGQELARKAQYNREFLAALSDFMHKYNAENAQVMETRQGPYRKSIQTSDITHIVALIDAHGSELICNLLIAFGYAREPREQEGGSDEKTAS